MKHPVRSPIVREHTFTRLTARLAVMVSFAVLLYAPSPALAQATLGSAESFAVLGGSAVTNTGPTVVTGDLGVSPGPAVTGFPPGSVIGAIHAADLVAGQAQSDLTTEYNDLAGQACNTVLTGTDLGGLTLTPGVYCFSSTAQLTGALTLDAGGDPNAVFIFQIGSTLTTASNSSVSVINGGSSCNVFWQVGSSATIGTNSAFIGNIVALTSITLTTGANVSGRALARNGAVTMDSNSVSAVCSPLPVPAAPTLGKGFIPAAIDENGVSILTITLSNPNTSGPATIATLIDNLPTGVVAIADSASTTCGGTVTVTTGTSGISTVTLTEGAIPAASSTASGTCTVTVNVTSTTPGVHLNTLDAGALVTDKGSNVLPAIATLTVNPPAAADVPPTLGKVFIPVTIDVGSVSTLTITLSNPNTSGPATIATLTDKLPTGVVIADDPNASTTCGAGLVTTGLDTVTLTGGSILAASSTASGTCTVTVNVTSTTPGVHLNTLDAGALVTDKGSNAAPAVATLTVTPVIIAPTLGKAFSPTTINADGISTLTITLFNPNTSGPATIATLTDRLPSGVVVAGNASTTCGGTVTANTGGSKVILTGGSIPANGSCTVTVNVTAKYKGCYCNKLPAGALQTDMGSNAAPAVATLTVTCTVIIAPTLGKAFSPTTINADGISTLTITLSNPNSTVASLTAPLTDRLPSGVVVAGNASTTCGGTVTANTGGSKVILTGGSIPAKGSCTVTVNVTAKYKGSYCNKLPAGALQTDMGSNAAPAVATLTVTPKTTCLISLTVKPSCVVGGTPSTGTVVLSSPAPSGGAVVTLSSSNTAVATVPASVTVPFNSTTATFTINTRRVTSRKTPSISATYRGTTKTVTLTVTR